MHVPLIVSLPETLTPRVVASPVGLVDLHPTIVELCGGQSSSLVEGHSLAGALRGSPRVATPILAESEYSLRSFGWAPLTSLRQGGKKYIEAPRPELFDTDLDPGELTDLSAQSSATLLALRGELASSKAKLTQREPEGIELDEQSSANLAALGYVEGASELTAHDLASLRDPKDVRHVYSGTMRAKPLFDQGKHQEVIDLLVPLLEESPESDEIWSLLAGSQLALGNHAAARDAYEKSLRVRPDLAGRLTGLAEALIGLQELEQAYEVLLRAEATAGDDPQIQSRLGLVLAKQGRLSEAEARFRRQEELAPDSPNAHVNLANCLLAQSRFVEGLGALSEALRLDPTCKPAWVARLQVLLSQGRMEEARAATRECLVALSGDAQFLQGLMALARSTGDPELIALVEDHLRTH
jgi:tetratricopeptide (TPR) repeat protein